jgi:hypothetical protein
MGFEGPESLNYHKNAQRQGFPRFLNCTSCTLTGLSIIADT